MKIISKPKDYYDYLQGIYGVDEKLILDRTKFNYLKHRVFNDSGQKLTFFICDKMYECLYLHGKFLYGDEIKALCKPANTYWRSQEIRWLLHVEGSHRWENIYFNLQEDIPTKLNNRRKCPIIVNHNNQPNSTPSYIDFPILSEYDFKKVIPAEKMWIELSNWLSKPVELPNNMSNKDKILSHGFDLKHSFRNTK